MNSFCFFFFSLCCLLKSPVLAGGVCSQWAGHNLYDILWGWTLACVYLFWRIEVSVCIFLLTPTGRVHFKKEHCVFECINCPSRTFTRNVKLKYPSCHSFTVPLCNFLILCACLCLCVLLFLFLCVSLCVYVCAFVQTEIYRYMKKTWDHNLNISGFTIYDIAISMTFQ